eukprot:COSAG04_NODE_1793_length_5565_cov_52.214782_3_plen_192_part_00
MVAADRFLMDRYDEGFCDAVNLTDYRMRPDPATDYPGRTHRERSGLLSALYKGAPLPSLFTRFRPYLAHFPPVFFRFWRVFTVSTARFQRAASRSPGPRNSGQAPTGGLGFRPSAPMGRTNWSALWARALWLSPRVPSTGFYTGTPVFAFGAGLSYTSFERSLAWGSRAAAGGGGRRLLAVDASSDADDDR